MPHLYIHILHCTVDLTILVILPSLYLFVPMQFLCNSLFAAFAVNVLFPFKCLILVNCLKITGCQM